MFYVRGERKMIGEIILFGLLGAGVISWIIILKDKENWMMKQDEKCGR